MDKQDEDDEVSDGIEIYVNLKSNQKLKESHFDEIDVRSQLEQQTENQQSKDSGWRFDKTNSMGLPFIKNIESKIPLAPSAILNMENDDKFCFLWPILAHLRPCLNGHPNRVSNYGQIFDKLGIQGFNFTNAI